MNKTEPIPPRQSDGLRAELERTQAEIGEIKRAQAEQATGSEFERAQHQQNAPRPEQSLDEESRTRQALLYMLEDVEENRHRIEQAHREWLQSVDALRDPVLVHDADFRVLRCNRAYAAHAGMEFRDIIGKPYWECFPKRAGPLHGCTTTEGEVGQDADREARRQEFTLDTGETFVSRAFVTLDSSGRYAQELHIFEDVTERKRLQSALERSERHFRKLIEGGADAFFVIDRAGNLLYRSESGEKLTGWTTADVLGRQITDFVPAESLPLARNTIRQALAIPEKVTRIELRLLRKDGTTVEAEVFGKNLLDDPDVGGIVVTARDITERKRAEAMRAELVAIVASSQDAIYSTDLDGIVTSWNPGAARLFGYSPSDMIGNSVTVLTREGVVDETDALRRRALRGEMVSDVEAVRMHKNGKTVDVAFTVSPILDAMGRAAGIAVIARDISERKRAALLVQRERDTAQRYFSLAGVIMLALHADGTVALINRKGLEILGYEESDVLGKPWIERFIQENSRDSVRSLFDRLISGHKEGVEHVEEAILCRGNEERLIAWTNVILTDEQGRISGTLSSGEDVTERRRSEREIKFKNAVLSTQQETALDAILLVDENAMIVSYNQRFIELWGVPAEMLKIGTDEAVLRSVVGQVENPEAFLARVEYLYRHADERSREEIRVKDGRILDRYSAPVIATDGTYYGRVWYFRDITERRRAETELRRLNWALRALGQSNSALVHAGSETELFQSCCDAIAGTGGHPLAWIGLAHNGVAHTVEIIAAAGGARNYLDNFAVSWADEPLGRGPTGNAIRTGVIQVTNDLTQSGAYQPWLQSAREYGLASSISLPIRANGAVMGVLAVYSREPDAFGKNEVDLFEELAADIGYGVAARRTRIAYEAGLVEREGATRKLRAAFESLIAVLAATVERRDPYTAGHQRRVAELASAIGSTLGFDSARLEGLHFAATIHDIGKIYVPAEILARPGKLPPTEFELVKSHAQVGYEIVKDVEFPWQVADMIRQHHERLDGSGYPQGLQGDQILLESRILAVADVVEAMSSHRPYRPGLGLDAALAQIRQEAGSKLDAQVVDACERVFREQGFSFSKA